MKTALRTKGVRSTSHVSLEELPFSSRLQILENSLAPAEKRMGQYFRNNSNAMFLSITEVVEDSGVGYGTIVRFCQKLGCAGFQEFKLLLAREFGSLNGNAAAFANSGDITQYSQKIISDLQNTQKLLDQKKILAIAEAIGHAGNVLITGIAGSAPLAIGFDYRLSRVGIRSSAVCDGYNLAIRAATLSSSDLFFAISFSGATKDILSAAKIAGKKRRQSRFAHQFYSCTSC